MWQWEVLGVSTRAGWEVLEGEYPCSGGRSLRVSTHVVVGGPRSEYQSRVGGSGG